MTTSKPPPLVPTDCAKENCGIMDITMSEVAQDWKIQILQAIQNQYYISPEMIAKKKKEEEAVAKAKSIQDDITAKLMAFIPYPRVFYGGGAAAVAIYSSIMFVAMNPGWKFDTFWNAGVAANFVFGMTMSASEAVLMLMTYIMTDSYDINYYFFFWSFIQSWYMITAFVAPTALMVISTVMETPEKMSAMMADGTLPKDTQLPLADASVYMVVNIAVGGGAAALMFMNKKGLYDWFVITFPNKLAANDLTQAMNVANNPDQKPLFDPVKAITAESIDGAVSNPLDTIKNNVPIKIEGLEKIGDMIPKDLIKFEKVSDKEKAKKVDDYDEWDF